jgi:hypothetical protein
MYKHKDVPKTLNVQSKKGQAKPYQIKQFLEAIENYDLKMEGEDSE